MKQQQIDTYKRVYARDGYRCCKCGETDQSKLQIAHRIRQGTKTQKNAAIKYIQSFIRDEIGERWSMERVWNDVIYHQFNLVCSCAKCNSSFNIFNNRIATEILLNSILDDINSA